MLALPFSSRGTRVADVVQWILLPGGRCVKRGAISHGGHTGRAWGVQAGARERCADRAGAGRAIRDGAGRLATGIDGATRTEVDGVIGAGLQGSDEFALIVDFGLEIGGALSDIADGVRV